MKDKIINHLNIIYFNVLTKKEINSLANEIIDLFRNWKAKINVKHLKPLSHEDVYLIAYGDSFYSNDGISPLKNLSKFTKKYLKNAITEIHILPHFPFSSDDGFSIIDYYKVNPEFGNWEDIKEIGSEVNMMFDFVINHMSAKSEWVKSFLEKDKDYFDFFIGKDDSWDYSNVIRPRTNNLFTKFFDSNGESHYLWTTFSEDQVDLNFRSKNVLLKSIDILLTYINYGARSIRLDAIGFLWKENNSTSIHLKQTHEIIKLWRTIFDEINKDILIITETNVPFEENISYFGNEDEAHLVYQFPLPPLTAHTLLTGNSLKIMKWMDELSFINNKTKISFFNFLASHDGIGMRPVEGILTKKEVEDIAKISLEKGGKINYRTNGDEKSIYELNINYYSLLENVDDKEEINIKRFIAANFLLLSMIGVPAIYYHTILWSRNYYKGVEETGINRRINREKYELSRIDSLLQDERTINSKIFSNISDLIKIRKNIKAFNPFGVQKSFFINSDLISFTREYEDEKILVVINVANKKTKCVREITGIDMITNKEVSKDTELNPYQFMWIKL